MQKQLARGFTILDMNTSRASGTKKEPLYDIVIHLAPKIYKLRIEGKLTKPKIEKAFRKYCKLMMFKEVPKERKVRKN